MLKGPGGKQKNKGEEESKVKYCDEIVQRENEKPVKEKGLKSRDREEEKTSVNKMFQQKGLTGSGVQVDN